MRSFLAFDISPEIKEKLALFIDDLSKKEKKIRWVNPENMHVTIKFFGEVEEEKLEEIASVIEKAVKNFGSFVLKSKGVGVFPNWKYPKVIWSGFVGETEKAVKLYDIIENALSGLGLEKDARAFRLHLTIGRTKSKIKAKGLIDVLERLGPLDFGDLVVDKLILYKSVLTKKGPVYTSLKEFALDK